MSTPPNGDRVTNKQLYDELKELRNDLVSKTEMRLTVALAVVGGNGVVALVLKVTAAGPAVHTALGHVLGLL